MASKPLGSFSPLLNDAGPHVYPHTWLFTWCWGIQTQTHAFLAGVSPTEDSFKPSSSPDPDAQLYHCGHPLGSSEFALLTGAHEMCLHS